jgi:hypothetical protein
MQHTTASQHRGIRHTISAAVWVVAAFWLVAGVVAVMAFDGGLTRSAIVLAIVSTEWWLVSKVENRFAGSDAKTSAQASLVDPRTA